MSFLKITDPKKRDLIVEEFLKTKRNIQDQQLEERMSEQDALSTFTKQFKPITDAQKSIISEIKPIKESLQDLPRALEYTQLPAIMESGLTRSNQAGSESVEPEMIGSIAAKYLRKFATKDADKTYGIYDKGGQFYIGDTRIGVIDDNIFIGDEEYQGTPGLWELIIMKSPDENVYTQDDYENYAEIMINTNALRKGNSNAPKSSKGWKWNNLLKDIWGERKQFMGEGNPAKGRAFGHPTLVIPSDPNALLERLDLLMASKAAGNTGVRNELVSICDELKRQKVLDANTYKKLMSIL